MPASAPSRSTPPRSTPTHITVGSACALRLWQMTHRPLPPLPTARASIVEAAREVRAATCPPRADARRISADLPHAEAVTATLAAASDPAVRMVYGAAATHRGLEVRLTRLRRQDAGWCAIEVHASSRLKGPHIDRLALVRWVFRGAGIPIVATEVLTLRSAYRYAGGGYDLNALFARHDVSEKTARHGRFNGLLSALNTTLQQPNPPSATVGKHCKKPQPCSLFATCHDAIGPSDHPISELPNLNERTRTLLQESGISQVANVPANFPLNQLQHRVRKAVQLGTPFVSPHLAAALIEVQFPLHHLDVETVMPALPRYPGTHPFEALPFQWSNHIEQHDGTVSHTWFLCDEDVDPREAFALSLLDAVGDTGSICIYTQYETQIVTKLAHVLPHLADRLLGLKARMWDLHKVLKQHFYHPAFRGSFALKRTLAVLVPGRTYEGMVVENGMAAAHTYTDLLRTTDVERRTELRQGLLTYCAQDTLAMVEMRHALARFAHNQANQHEQQD